jgi:hypothetical protein
MEKIAVRKLENIETTQMWLLWFFLIALIGAGVVGGFLLIAQLISKMFG